MMTAAGTIPAAKVLVVGAGVAGLQAIATAKRMGSIVYPFPSFWQFASRHFSDEILIIDIITAAPKSSKTMETVVEVGRP